MSGHRPQQTIDATRGKQREYAEYIAGAKREETRSKRLQKVFPMIEAGIGLNDKYRNGPTRRTVASDR